MRLIVTGTGDAFSNSRFGSSCLIETSAGFIAIDCPGSPLMMYRQAAMSSGLDVDPAAIHDILVTHLHCDHVGGIETMAFYRKYIAPESGRPGLWAAPAVMDRMWERLAPSMDGRQFGDTAKSKLEEYFDPGLLSVEQAVEVAGLRIQARWTRHSVPTVGLLISDGEVTLGWSGDTEFESEHVEWLSQADLIIHECGQVAKHARLEELATLPTEIQDKMKLIHVPDSADFSSSPMQRLSDGDVLEIQAAVPETT